MRSSGRARGEVGEVSFPFARNLAAGTFCGSIVVMTFNPLDCLRIRWQVTNQRQYKSITHFSHTILQKEGLIQGLWKPGLIVNGLAASVSVGTRMGIYPFLRDGMIAKLQHQTKHPGVMWFAGLLPGMFGYWVSTPLWQIKTRIQAEAGIVDSLGVLTTGIRKGHPPTIRSLSHGLVTIYNTQGLGGLYRGAVPLMIRGGMMSSGQFLGYDFTKTQMKGHGWMKDGPMLHALASTTAAFLSTTFAAPFDIIMTRYQAAPTLGIHYKSVLHCAATMARSEGLTVFYRGWSVFFSRVAPVFTCLMPFYEQVRVVLGLGYLN
ncbi:hypothetical protein AAMO2058_001220500 [Amorphochlora amoebiformis]